MISRASAWALRAAACAFVMLGAGSLDAQEICGDNAAEKALEEFVSRHDEAVLGAASGAFDVWKAYLSSPDDQKLTATLNALGKAGADIIIPGYGTVSDGVKIAVARVEYTIEEARSQQINALLCGGASGGERLPGTGFFELNGTQAISPGITCENFSERITTSEQFDRLKQLYDGYYSRLVYEMGGRQNREAYTQILYQQWQVIERTWKARRGVAIYEKLRSDLAIDAQALQGLKSCAAGVADTGEAKADEPKAEGGGPHFELVKADPVVFDNSPEWAKSVSPGNATMQAPFGHAECTWSGPPEQVYLEGFTMTINLSVTSIPTSNHNAIVEVRSGFLPPANGTSVELFSQGGETKSGSLELLLKPVTFDFLKTGDPLYMTVGGCNAGYVAYTFEFRAE